MSAVSSSLSKPLKTTATVFRYLLGAVFLIFGLNGFLNFIPQPDLPLKAMAFMKGLSTASYFFPLVKGLEVLAGAFLLSNRFVPLAIAILGPITLNIFMFHLTLTPLNPVAFIVFLGNLFLAYAYQDHFKGVFAK